MSVVTKINDLERVASLLKLQTGENVKPCDKAILECFKKYCSIGGYEPYVWDHQFIGAFECTQSFLIEKELIDIDNCMVE